MTESEKPKPHPVFERLNELTQISQGLYGMERLMAIWISLLPEGQIPRRGVDPVNEILRLEFPDLLKDFPDWDDWGRRG